MNTFSPLFLPFILPCFFALYIPNLCPVFFAPARNFKSSPMRFYSSGLSPLFLGERCRGPRDRLLGLSCFLLDPRPTQSTPGIPFGLARFPVDPASDSRPLPFPSYKTLVLMRPHFTFQPFFERAPCIQMMFLYLKFCALFCERFSWFQYFVPHAAGSFFLAVILTRDFSAR